MKAITTSHKYGFEFLINIWFNGSCASIILHFMDKKVHWSSIKPYNVLKCWRCSKSAANDYIHKTGICAGFSFFINKRPWPHLLKHYSLQVIMISFVASLIPNCIFSEIEKQNMNDWKTNHDVSSLGIIILINLSGTMYIGFTFM